MKFEKPIIGIIGGKGRMGNWFKIFFEKQGLKVIISDKNTKLSNIELAKKADIVVVSVPLPVAGKVIKEIRSYVKRDALLTDLASLKTGSIKAMKKAKCGILGMHPLFGPLAENLKNQNIVFCRFKNHKYITFLKKIFIANGAKIIEISPEKHDLQMAYLQALVHFFNIAFSYFLYVKKFRPMSSLFTPLFKLQSLTFGRILAQDSKVYAGIEIENPYFRKLLQDYLKEIIALQKDIERKDYQKFQKKFNNASSYLSNFVKIAQVKTAQILKIIEGQPIKIGRVGNINLKRGRIGYLGPKGTFSFLAAKKISRNNKSQLLAFLTIRDIFEAVLNREIDFGVVPIENSITGLVSETIQCFIDFPVYALGSLKLPIHHCLLSKAKRIKDIKIIKSHPQALLQCRFFLEENLPDAVKEPASSTVSPILESCSKDTGFIAPCESQNIFKLNVLAKNIENRKDNFTRFFLICDEMKENFLKKIKSKAKNTLLLISVYDRVGVLRDILNVFAEKGINLTALHSISAYSKHWDYLFFLEIERSCFSSEMKDALRKLEEFCPFVRVLGLV